MVKKSDFDIIIGANISNVEQSLDSVLSKLKEDYFLKLKTDVDNKDIVEALNKIKEVFGSLDLNLEDDFNKIIKSVNELQEVMRGYENDIFSSGDAWDAYEESVDNVLEKSKKLDSELQDIDKHIEDIDKTLEDVVDEVEDWQESLSDISDEMEEAKKRTEQQNDAYEDTVKNVKDVGKELKENNKEIEKQADEMDELAENFKKTMLLSELKNTGEDEVSRTVEKKGNKFLNQTELSSEKSNTTTTVKDFEKLDNYIENINDKLKKMEFVTKENTSEVDELNQSFMRMKQILEDGTDAEALSDEIEKSKRLVNDITQKEIQLKKESNEIDKVTVLQKKEIVKWEANLEKYRKGYTVNNLQDKALEKRINLLKNGEFKTLEEIENVLKEIGVQYQKNASSQERDTFLLKKKNNVSKIDNKVKNTIDPEIIAGNKDLEKSYESLKKNIIDAFSAKNPREYELALKNIDIQYQNLKRSQAEIIQKNKQQAQEQRKIIELQTKADLEKQKNTKAIDVLNSNGLVPKETINEINKLNSSLDFSSGIKDFAKITNLIKEAQDEEKKITAEKKKQEFYHKLFLQQQKLTNSQVDLYESKLEKVLHQTDTLIKNEQVQNEIKSKASVIQEKINKAKETGVKITEEESKEIAKQITDLQRLYGSKKGFEANKRTLSKKSDDMDGLETKTRNDIVDEDRLNAVLNEINATRALINAQKEQGRVLTDQENNLLDEQIRKTKRIHQENLKVEKSLNSEKETMQQLSEKIDSVVYRSTRGFDKFPKQMKIVEAEITKLQKELLNLSTKTGDSFDKQLESVKRQILQLNQTAREQRDSMMEEKSSFGGRFQHALSQVPVWASAMQIYSFTTQQFAQGWQTILDIDKAMINLQKVTEATKEELNEFKQTALDIGGNLGVLTSDVINATASFQKLGFTLEQSTLLGQNSIIYANVGDMGLEQATENIVSTVKGFGIEIDREGKNITNVIDIMNEVGNNFAISSEGIGEALKRSSAVLYQSGNTIEQAVALATGANTTIQDPEKVGTALKTVAMRLRGVDEDGSKVIGLVPQLESSFKSLGISMMKDETTFKSTFEIFDELADNWENLSDIQRANMTELIGGKHQGSVVASMLANWTDAQNSYESALNSTGSAQREYNEYMDSFTYKMGVLKNAVEGLWIAFSDSDAIKVVIESLTMFVNGLTFLVEKLGGMPVLVSAVLIAVMAMNQGFRDTVFGLGSATLHSKLFAGALSMIGVKSKATAISMATLKSAVIGVATSMLGFGVGLVGAVALGWAIELAMGLASKKSDELKAKIEALDSDIREFDELMGKMKSQNFDIDEYTNLSGKMDNKSISGEEYKKLIDMQNEAKANIPELISHYDEYGQAVLKSTSAITKLIDEKRKLNAENQAEKLSLEIEEADFSKFEKETQNAQDQMNKMNKNRETAKAVDDFSTFLREAESTMSTDSKEFREKVLQHRKTIMEAMNGSGLENTYQRDVFLGMEALLEGQSESIKNTANLMGSTASENADKYSNQLKASEIKMDTAGKQYVEFAQRHLQVLQLNVGLDSKSNEFKILQDFVDSYVANIHAIKGDKSVEEALNELPEYLTSVLNDMKDGGFNGKGVGDLFKTDRSVQDIDKNFNTMIDMYKDKGDAMSTTIVDVLTKIKDEQIAMSEELISQPMPDINLPLMTDNFLDSVSSLDSAYRQLADGQSLSSKQVTELIIKYPELEKHMKIKNKTLMLEKDAIKLVHKEREKAFKDDIRQNRAMAVEKQKEVAKKIEAMAREQGMIIKLDSTRKKDLENQIKAYEAKAFTNIVQNQYGGHLEENRFNAVSSQASKEAEKLKEILGQWTDIGDSIKDIDDLLNNDFSSNIGTGANSGSKPDKDKDKDKKELQDAIYYADKYGQALANINHKIAMLQKTREKYVEGSKAYNKTITDEIKLQKQKKKTIDDEIKSLELQIKKKSPKNTGVVQVGKKDDNKTERAKKAELQAEVDKLKLDLLKLKEESKDIELTISELNMDLINVNTKSFQEKAKAYEDEIAFAEYTMSLYDQHSKEYQKYAEKKIAYMKEQQKYNKQELDYLVKQRQNNKDLTYSQKKELDDLIAEKKQELYSINSSIQDMVTEIGQIEIDKVLAGFDLETTEYEKSIRDLRDKMKYDTEDGDYASNIKNLQSILALNKGQLEDYKGQLAKLEEMKKKYKDNHELVKQINDEINNIKDSIYNQTNAIKDNNKEIKDLYEKLADEMVELYKKQLELQRDAENEKYEEMMKNERKIFDEKMKNYDKELNKLREIYNQKMQSIDRQESTRKYDNQLENLQKEETDLQKKIDELALDDSYEAKAKRNELMKQLAEKRIEIEELMHEREIELRKDGLDDELKTEEEKIENKKDALQEEFDKFVENEEKKKKERDKYWEQQLNDEKKFAEIRKQIMAGNFKDMEKVLGEWSKNVNKQMEHLGSSITNNFTDKIQEAINKLTELGKLGLGSFDGTINVGGNNQDGNYKPNENGNSGGLNPDGSNAGSGSSGGGSSNSKKYAWTTKSTPLKSNIYSNGKIIHNIGKGSRVEVTGEKSGWCSVRHNAKVGWVFKKDLTFTQPKGKSVEEPSMAKTTSEQTMLSTENSRSISIPQGTNVNVLKSDNEKALVEYAGVQGNIDPRFLNSQTEYDSGIADISSAISRMSMKMFEGKDVAIENIREAMKIMKTSMTNVNTKSSDSSNNTENNTYNIELNIENMSGNKRDIDKISDAMMKEIKRTKGGRF